MSMRASRRDVLKISTAAAAGAVMPYWFSSRPSLAQENKSPNERLTLGCIGTGDRWMAVGPQAMKYSDCVAVCDVDANHMRQGVEVAKKNRAKGSTSRLMRMRTIARSSTERH